MPRMFGPIVAITTCLGPSLLAQTSFYAVPPCRAVDTRTTAGTLGGPPLGAGVPRTFTLSNVCGIPPQASSVVANATVVDPTSGGTLTIYPDGEPTPGTSSLSFGAGQTRAGDAVLLLGAGGGISVLATMAGGSTDFVLDISGYFAAPAESAGEWVNVTPSGIDLVDPLDCGNYGAQTVAVDPRRPTDLYATFGCQGIYKSTDYGSTWHGPIDLPEMRGAGGLTVASQGPGLPPVLYVANIRSPGTGFWRSLDGGATWNQYDVTPGGSRQDYYPPAVDPYDSRHLLMAAHEMNDLVESSDGGETWTAVSLAAGMEPGGTGGGTAFPFFIDTGAADTTRRTWLWISQTGGPGGTWRTADGGATWVLVDKNQHAHGVSQIYVQTTGGSVFMAGVYSDLGWGVLHSLDYGQSWSHVGNTGTETIVFASPKNVYAEWGWPAGQGITIAPNLEVAPQPGTAGWNASPTPGAMSQGPAQAAVTFDGTRSIIVTANYNAGLWRYVEP